MLIKEFLKRSVHLYISAPTGFGKTTNMDMIKRFCEIRVDRHGEAVHPIDTENYKLFAKNNLLIFREAQFFDRHFGKYPVIYVDFSDLTVSSFDDFLVSFRTAVHDAFGLHRYLKDCTQMDADQRETFDRMCGNGTYRDAGEGRLVRCLRVLASILFLHFRKKAVVLIDEHDAPLHRAIYANSSAHLGEISNFLLKVTRKLLDGNAPVRYALINARIRLVPLTVHDSFPLRQVPFLSDRRLAGFYGFTGSEVEELLTRSKAPDCRLEVRNWYGGYKAHHDGKEIYNVRALLAWLQKRRRIPLSLLGGDPSALQYFKRAAFHDSIRFHLASLLEDKGVRIEYDNSYDRNEILELESFVKSAKCADRAQNNLFFRYLTDLGYCYLRAGNTSGEAILRVPNEETYNVLSTRVYSKKLLKNKFAVETQTRRTLSTALLATTHERRGFEGALAGLHGLFPDENAMPVTAGEFCYAAWSALRKNLVEEVGAGGSLVRRSGREAAKPIHALVLRADNSSAVIEFLHARDNGDLSNSFETKNANELFSQENLDRYAGLLDSKQFAGALRETAIYIKVYIKFNGVIYMCYMYNNSTLIEKDCLD